MIVLNREMENPKTPVRGRCQGAADGRKDPDGPQAADGGATAEGDMHRVRRDVCRPGSVRDAGAAPGGELAAGASAAAAPSTRRGEGKLQGARHLDQAIIALYLALSSAPGEPK